MNSVTRDLQLVKDSPPTYLLARHASRQIRRQDAYWYSRQDVWGCVRRREPAQICGHDTITGETCVFWTGHSRPARFREHAQELSAWLGVPADAVMSMCRDATILFDEQEPEGSKHEEVPPCDSSLA